MSNLYNTKNLHFYLPKRTIKEIKKSTENGYLVMVQPDKKNNHYPVSVLEQNARNGLIAGSIASMLDKRLRDYIKNLRVVPYKIQEENSQLLGGILNQLILNCVKSCGRVNKFLSVSNPIKLYTITQVMEKNVLEDLSDSILFESNFDSSIVVEGKRDLERVIKKWAPERVDETQDIIEHAKRKYNLGLEHPLLLSSVYNT